MAPFRRLSKSITWLVILTWLVSLPIGQGGLELCLGSNGHVAIEPLFHENASDADTAVPVPSGQSAHSAAQSSPCTDFPLAEAPSVRSKHAQAALADVPRLTVVTIVFPSASRPPVVLSADEPVSPDYHRRSVILLI
jgi:hypothetical protein